MIIYCNLVIYTEVLSGQFNGTLVIILVKISPLKKVG